MKPMLASLGGFSPLNTCQQWLPDNQKGVYWLVAVDDEMRPSPIPRLTGIDPYGILYIGCANEGSLRQRAGNELAKGLLTVQPGDRWGILDQHHGVLYDYLHSKHVREQYPKERLALAWVTAKGGADDAKWHEQKCYYNYRQQFGERPPFNRDFSMCRHIKEPEKNLLGPLVMPDDVYYYPSCPNMPRTGAPGSVSTTAT